MRNQPLIVPLDIKDIAVYGFVRTHSMDLNVPANVNAVYISVIISMDAHLQVCEVLIKYMIIYLTLTQKIFFFAFLYIFLIKQNDQ